LFVCMDSLTTLVVNGLKTIVPCVTTLSSNFPKRCFMPASPGLITAQPVVKTAAASNIKSFFIVLLLNNDSKDRKCNRTITTSFVIYFLNFFDLVLPVRLSSFS
jgi:hypothetical protein